ncbi:MAG: TrmB family transcriptional regulator [Chloroflexi bacterium]|nr:TrmB family transcriptional regulator [Chloroflexota bacterium]
MDDDFLKKLLRISFTEYEAKVYLALVRQSPSTGYQLSKAAGVPRSMVYEALGRLDARGIVLKTIEHRATLYRPLPPDVLLDRYEQENHQLIHDLRLGLQELYTSSNENYIWSISGRPSVLSYAAKMIQGASQEVLLVLADADLDALRGDIEDACVRSVSISALLTGEGQLSCGRTAYHSPIESELQDLTRDLVVVVDNQEALIARTDLEMSATITRNRNLVLISRQFVWMELFTQRIYTFLDPAQLTRMDPEDRQFFAGLSPRLP